MKLLIRSDSCNAAIVFHTNQEPPSIGIGKGTKCARNFARVFYAHFKILLLVFAFSNHLDDIGHVRGNDKVRARCEPTKLMVILTKQVLGYPLENAIFAGINEE